MITAGNMTALNNVEHGSGNRRAADVTSARLGSRRYSMALLLFAQHDLLSGAHGRAGVPNNGFNQNACDVISA